MLPVTNYCIGPTAAIGFRNTGHHLQQMTSNSKDVRLFPVVIGVLFVQ